jgi:hypothetical protein
VVCEENKSKVRVRVRVKVRVRVRVRVRDRVSVKVRVRVVVALATLEPALISWSVRRAGTRRMYPSRVGKDRREGAEGRWSMYV